MWIPIAIVGVVVLWVVVSYNLLVRARNMVSEAWSGIDVQLKRRHDLIPNIVECVKGYSAHERELFENLSQAERRVCRGRTARTAATRSSGTFWSIGSNA